jgi:hypothetical protein
VALHHVDERPCLVVVARPALEAEALVVDDLDRLHVLVAPDRLQQAVGEADPEDVEHVTAAEEVVDPEDLLLGHQRRHELVERPGVVEACPERLLHGEHRSLGQVQQP